MTGSRAAAARSSARTTFSPAATPIVPPKALNVAWISTAGCPATFVRPVRTDSAEAARTCAA